MSLPVKITSDLAALNTDIAAIKFPKVTQAQITALKNISSTISADLAGAFKADQDALLVANNGLTAMTAQVATLNQQVVSVNEQLIAAQASLEAAKVKITALEAQIANQPQPPVLQTETQTLACPVGQSGQITQIRKVTAWQTDSNTCVDNAPNPPSTLIPSPNGTRGAKVIDQQLNVWTLGDEVLPQFPGQFHLLRNGLDDNGGEAYEYLMWNNEVYARSTDAYWVWRNNTWIKVGADPSIPPVPTPTPEPVPPGPGFTRGSITLISVPSVPQWGQGMKHVSPCFHPPSGRVYFNNGDYRGYDGKYGQSYMQETCSADIAALLAATTQEELTAVFRLEYPYEGFGGTTVQPKHPDFMGWMWDDSRKVFWLIPGQTFASNDVAPGETTLGHDDPCFKYGVFTFDPDKPMQERWKLITSDRGPNNQETWMSVIHGDTLFRFGFNGGSGSVVDHVDLSTLASGNPEWKTNGVGDGSWRINKEYLAHDVEGLKVYAIDGIKNRVMSFSFLDYSVEDLGPSPGAPANVENYRYVLFNSKHRLLEFLNSFDATLYVADVDARPLVWKVAATGVLNHRMGVYDPKNDCSLWAGGLDPGIPQMTIFKVAAVPDWVPKPGFVAEIPATNTMGSVMYGTPAGPGSGAGADYLNLWTSGVYCKNDGPFGSLALWSGGDADYWGNEVYKFSLEQLKWSRENERSIGLNGVTTTPDGDPNFDPLWVEHSDANGKQPGVPHDYDQAEYLPSEMGGGLQGSVLFPTRTIVYRYRPAFHPHAFDLAMKAWRRASTAPNIINMDGTGLSCAAWARDDMRKRYWGIPTGPGPIANNFIWWQDFDSTGMATGGQQILQQGGSSLEGYPTTRVVGDLLVVVGHRSGTFAIEVLDLTKLDRYVAVTLTGDIPPASQGPGVALLGGKLYLRAADGNRQNLWEITPGAWSVKMITMQGAVVAATGNPNGMWKRLMAVEALECLMWVDDVNGPVYAFKP